jgi:hypothetical protein
MIPAGVTVGCPILNRYSSVSFVAIAALMSGHCLRRRGSARALKSRLHSRPGTEALSVWQPGGGRNRIVARELVAGLTEARAHPISHERYLSTGQRSLSVCFRRRNIDHRSALYPKQTGTHALYPRPSKHCQCDRPSRDAPRSANDYQGEIDYLSGFQRRCCS